MKHDLSRKPDNKENKETKMLSYFLQVKIILFTLELRKEEDLVIQSIHVSHTNTWRQW